MIYADYTFYVSTFGSTKIPQTSYAAYAHKAGAILDDLTYGRLRLNPAWVTEDIKMAACAIAEQAFSFSGGSEGGYASNVQSESVDGWSVTYGSESDNSASRINAYSDVLSAYIPLSSPLRSRWL